jgi:hypothetical protein
MGLDWFPFDVTLLTDRKLRRPRAQFGSAAVLTYIALLSLIYRDKGYYLAYQGDGREDVALDVADLIGGALASDALAQADQIQKIIRALVDRGLFDRACFEAGVLTSRRIQRTYYNAVAERTSVQINWDVWILSEEEMNGIQNNNPILNLYRKEKEIYDKPNFSPEKPIFPAEKSNFLAKNSYRIGEEKREEEMREDEMRGENGVVPLRGISGADAPQFNYQLYADYWNHHIAAGTKLTKVRDPERWSAKRKKRVRDLVHREGEAGVLAGFDRVSASDFLTGRSGKWLVDFDWVVTADHFQKICEGRYDNGQVDEQTGSFYDKLARGDL